MSESSQGGKFDSNLGGVAIRYGEVSGVIGVFERPTPPADWDDVRGRADGRGPALFRLQVPRADLPGRWVCLNRRFVLVEE